MRALALAVVLGCGVLLDAFEGSGREIALLPLWRGDRPRGDGVRLGEAVGELLQGELNDRGGFVELSLPEEIGRKTHHLYNHVGVSLAVKTLVDRYVNAEALRPDERVAFKVLGGGVFRDKGEVPVGGPPRGELRGVAEVLVTQRGR